jgi:hypothetical protein
MADRFFGSAIVLFEAGQLEVVGKGPPLKETRRPHSINRCLGASKARYERKC